MNFKKLLQKLSLLLLFIIPINVFAYSNYVIPGGQNIGINVDLQNVSIVGFYEVNGKNIAQEAGFKIGDIITKINNDEVTSIDEMVSIINKYKNNDKLTMSIKRSGESITLNLPIVEENNILKTGLYVKDKITGIGTLTYIDPTTKIFGALGHEIIDKNTSLKVDIKDGNIFKSEVISITPSENGNPGEKNAKFYKDTTYGNITKNEEEGIFGYYNGEINEEDAVEIMRLEDVKIGKAYLETVIDSSDKEKFEINILEVYTNSDTKNILFEITDEKLLNSTNGVVAGMSGSPIYQDGKLIAACTHVVVNNPHKGFAISIENMLKEGEN